VREGIHDVAVVGAGPAGATAARVAAEAGCDTVVIDRATFPRDKPCAGGVSQAALDLLGVELPADLVLARCDRLLTWHRGLERSIVHSRPFVFTVRRGEFDSFLLERARRAGARVVEGEGVSRVDAGPWGVRLEGHRRIWRARLVIACDGVAGRISRALAGPFRRSDLAYCVALEAAPLDETTRPAGGAAGQSRPLEVDYGLLPRGYAWAFPRQDTYAVGLGAPVSSLSDGRPGLEHRLRQFLHRRRLQPCSPVEGAFVPICGPRRPVVGDGWLLAGDAAGFADPFSGEGIRYAIWSGTLAARAAARCLAAGNPGTVNHFQPYVHWCRRGFGNDLAWARRAQDLLLRFPSALLAVYFSSERPFHMAARILDGAGSYRDLVFWLAPRLPAFAIGSALRRLVGQTPDSSSP